MSYLQGLILGLLQGFAELFPISSLGHSIILARLFGWHIEQQDPFFLTFLVGTHFATALVLFVFFFKDWMRIFAGIFRSLRQREIRDSDPDAKLGWLLVVGTIPAGILGLLFEEEIRTVFVSARSAAFFLLLNGLLLFGAEMLRRKIVVTAESADSDTRIAKVGWGQALGVGAFQAIALIPGFSRTGASLTGGLLAGLSHEDAARYSFLLATPIIAAAAVLKLPELATASGQGTLGPTLVGGVGAAITAYFSVRFLTSYFETNKLTPFAYYCVAAGLLTSLFFLF